ncbi:hypothetical protein [Micromonospora yangpuensis]|uniref:Uncharacterized protein n=1 Tax=Micromonospora yangpuensis TaxID=683228 RepID=A0A1C6VDP7_9ACTN|nr:hypothetical protein [Micromonospora yangpuensis]GGM13980.1 hypothetical protein GCM10012279_35220 [Micromonospora yangpuensis]SCL64458.1 hypothetical protein GA0070617_5477 [Micromonospora yangpuensis]
MRGFAALPPAQRELAAAVGSLTRWSRVTSKDARKDALAPARAARQKQWERRADPDGTLSPEELAAAVARLKAAHIRRMAMASARSRAAKSQAQ